MNEDEYVHDVHLIVLVALGLRVVFETLMSHVAVTLRRGREAEVGQEDEGPPRLSPAHGGHSLEAPLSRSQWGRA